MTFRADRVYRHTEPIRWRGKKIGNVVGFQEPLGGTAMAVVEVSGRTLKDMESLAAHFILERGNVVEVYKK